MKKVSILTPTYNDADTIEETLDSIANQTYENWELIIVNDGSTDNTEKIIKKYIKKHNLEDKIKYIYQENKDQLRALENAIQYITGDYVYILHSDDLFYAPNSVNKSVKYLEENTDLDGIIGPLTTIDENGNVTGKIDVLEYKRKEKIIATQLLWLGRNLYIDIAFLTKEAFFKYVTHNYITWNRPFWLDIKKDGVSMANIKTVPFSIMKYRLHSGNYANNELGKLCLINGELRTATRLMKFYNIPLYKFQYLIFRSFCKLKLFNIYRPIYLKKETKNKGKIVEYIIKKRYKEDYKKYEFLVSLVNFYKNKNHRTIDFDKIYNGKDKVYLGNDMRTFNKKIIDRSSPPVYSFMFEEMNKGFDEIIVSKKNEKNAINLLKFLCIYPHVTIRSSKNEKENS